MEKPNAPDKQRIRDWLRHRRTANSPPPDIEQIRRELGWTPAQPGYPVVRERRPDRHNR